MKIIMFLISIILILLFQLCIAQVGLPPLPLIRNIPLNLPLNDGENQNNGTSSRNDDRNGLPLIRRISLIPFNYNGENQNNGTSSGNDDRNGPQIFPMIRGMRRGRVFHNRENQNNGSSENDGLQIPPLIGDILNRRQSRQRESEQL